MFADVMTSAATLGMLSDEIIQDALRRHGDDLQQIHTWFVIKK